ncbi:HD domain-containing protein [Paenibacillus sp.]|uniref:HD domain-containing protein n=1 Tax=Paenibacillus sp. TaxID=58172 RepID=UPI002D72F38F|nr:HD domain-containing protein [Paenibacillus sp.]HZG57248.1 HD domain-containing protein [Paenibacillus sp.]
MFDYRLRLDGALDEIWEPLWRLPVRLFPVEKALLRSKTVRRLHYVRHGGAFYINSHHTYSRLQHTLGVFALAAHFDPMNRTLRAAALLHDIGHAPFSHTLDSIEGVDHHQWTRQAVCSAEIADILTKEKMDPAEVLAYIDGTRRSLLRNADGALHADHLDSWVRSAFAGGYLPASTRRIMAGIDYRNGSLRFTLTAGRTVAKLIFEEASMHGSPANIGINAMLRKLVLRLITEGKLEVAALPAMTDAHVEQLLRSEESTCEAYEKLLTESWRIRVTREQPAVPAETAALRKLYLAMPLVGDVPITESSPSILTTVKELEQRLGTYYVWWDGDSDR